MNIKSLFRERNLFIFSCLLVIVFAIYVEYDILSEKQARKNILNVSYVEAKEYALWWAKIMQIENPRINCEMLTITNESTKICSIFGDNMRTPISIVCNAYAFCYVK